MYTQELQFKLTGDKDTEHQVEVIFDLLSSMRSNYQILARIWPIADEDYGYSAFVNTPEQDSLAGKYHNKYVKEDLGNLAKAGLALQIKQRGRDPQGRSACECTNHHAGFFLYTTHLAHGTPLFCFECAKPVPLYKIPKTYDDEYYNIRQWSLNYQAYDTLQMSCVAEEAQILDEISNIDSDLTRQGLDLCELIEDLTGNKTYYYLMRANGVSEITERNRKCPGCGADWYRPEQLHNRFDFVCEECRLLSNIAWSIDPEESE